MKTKIMVVEDDINLGFLLVDFLEANNFDVKLYKDGDTALRGFELYSFDFCILDIMLPGISGFELANYIRKKNKKVPIIFLTAKSQKEDILKGYEIGADDYITKPFDEDQLLCKINAILKRVTTQEDKKTEIFNIESFVFDYKNQLLKNKKSEKRLTKTENEVLKILCLQKNRIIKRDDILTKVWGNNDYFNGRSLDVFITKLRKYISEDPNIAIENVPTVGFKLTTKTL